MKRTKALVISVLWLLLFFGIRLILSAATAITGPGGFEGILQAASDNSERILLLSNIITPLFVLFTVKLNNNRLSDSLGFHRAGIFGLFISIVLAIVATPVVRFLVELIRIPEGVSNIFDKLSVLTVFNNDSLPAAAVILLVPVCEELVFRGAIFNTMNSAFTKFTTVFITTLFYALIHPDIHDILFWLIMGLFINLLFARFNSLWAAIFAHIFCILTYKYFDINVYRENLRYGVLAICGAAVIAVLLWMLSSGISALRGSVSEEEE